MTSSVALISSFAATASISVPLVVRGLTVYGVKHGLVEVTKSQLVEFARTQGSTKTESREFGETADWLIKKTKDIWNVFTFSKTMKAPLSSVAEPKLLKTYTELDKYAEISLTIKQASQSYFKKQKMLGSTLEKLNE